MTKEDLDKANELDRNLRNADKNFTDVAEWKVNHENAIGKDLSFSKAGQGWVSIPGEKKQEVLNLVHDITLKIYKEAQIEFDNFQPETKTDFPTKCGSEIKEESPIDKLNRELSEIPDKDIIEKSKAILSDLCNGGKKFTMQVPPSKNCPDLILSELIERFKRLTNTESNSKY